MSTMMTTGLSALDEMFAAAKAQHRAAFLPYYPIGYPDYQTSIEAIVAMSEVGVDGFEIGMPFSDPLADGPVIQAATQVALKNGVGVADCIRAVGELRSRGVSQPMLLMGYLNPVMSYGFDRFAADAKAAGASGAIIPDLPPEEAGASLDACRREGMAHVFLLAPTSNQSRIEIVSRKASGFIYLVSLTGITGARAELSPEVPEFVARVRAKASQPLVLGFGISTPAHARMMNGLVDGFIVGSALVRAGAEGVDAVRDLAKSLRAALDVTA
jgi:tryptophan synthase alpha chain